MHSEVLRKKKRQESIEKLADQALLDSQGIDEGDIQGSNQI